MNNGMINPEVFVENNQGLIWSVVKRFLGRGYDTEDIYQIGALGFVKAIRKFDLSLNLYTPEQAINYLTRKYSLLLTIYSIISYVTIFTLTGAIVFGTFTKLNKKAYLRNENKIYTYTKRK